MGSTLQQYQGPPLPQSVMPAMLLVFVPAELCLRFLMIEVGVRVMYSCSTLDMIHRRRWDQCTRRGLGSPNCQLGIGRRFGSLGSREAWTGQTKDLVQGRILSYI